MEENKCTTCNINPREHKYLCHPCSRASTKIYEKTPKGYLVRTYRNMTNRVKGILKSKAHLYEGLPICDKQEFYSWSLSEDNNYLTLLDDYKISGYLLNLAPSIDRIDSSEGYIFGNMRWVTFESNSSTTKCNRDLDLPVGIIKNRGQGYIVSKTIRGVHSRKVCSTLEEAKEFLASINYVKT